MRDRTLLAHSALAALAVIAAGFAAWGPELRDDATDVVVLPGKAEELRAVAWHDDRYDVVVRRSGAGAEQLQVEVISRPKPAPANPKAAPADPKAAPADPKAAPADPKAAPAADPGSEAAHDDDDDPDADPGAPGGVATPTGPPKVYPGSPQAKELFAAMAPLMAPRSLGMIETANLKPMGLETPAERLEVEQPSGRKALAIGDAVYGSGDRYARAESGEVFLLPAKTLSSLRNGGTALIERRALPVEAAKVVRVEITAGAAGREVIQRFAEEKDKAFYADPAVPDQKLEQVSNWLDRVLKLRIVDFADAAPSGPPTVTLDFYSDAATKLGTLSLWAAGEKIALAQSTFFGATVTLSKANAEAVLRDVEAVLAEGR